MYQSTRERGRKTWIRETQLMKNKAENEYFDSIGMSQFNKKKYRKLQEFCIAGIQETVNAFKIEDANS